MRASSLLLLGCLSAGAGASAAQASDMQFGACVLRGVPDVFAGAVTEEIRPLMPLGDDPLRCVEIAGAVETMLRRNGYFAARVFVLPVPQATKIDLQVELGRLAEDGVVLGRSSALVDDDVILDQTRSAVVPGSALTAEKYERALLLLGDLPGVRGSEAVLRPGDVVGEAVLEIHPADAPAVQGVVYADNFGSVYTGEHRVGAAVDFNSPMGRGDKLTLGANVSDERTYYVSIDGSVPLFDDGLRIGLAGGYLDYRTDESDGLRGSSRDVSAYATYPVIRSRATNLRLEGRIGRDAMKDEDNTSTVTDRVVDTARLKFSGDRRDGVMGGALTAFSVEAVLGDIDLDGYTPYRLEDSRTANTAGDFTRIVWSLSRLQHLAGPWQVFGEVAGQFASKRMDSSQSLTFGGPYDFPGYSSGEVLGDEGYRVHADIRYNWPESLVGARAQLSAFYGIGSIETHAKDIRGQVVVPGVTTESYAVQSAGVGASLKWDNVGVQAVVARRLANEIPSNLLDRDRTVSGWLQVVYEF